MEIVNSEYFFPAFVVLILVLTILIKLRSLLHDYIDRLRSEWSNHKKTRKRVVDPDNFSENEVLAPLLAPSWTRDGYEGRLKKAVIKACKLSDNQENQHQRPEQQEQSDSNNELTDGVIPTLSRNYNEEEVEQPKQPASNNESADDVLSILSKNYSEGEAEKEEEVEEEVVEEEVMLTSSDNQPIN